MNISYSGVQIHRREGAVYTWWLALNGEASVLLWYPFLTAVSPCVRSVLYLACCVHPETAPYIFFLCGIKIVKVGGAGRLLVPSMCRLSVSQTAPHRQLIWRSSQVYLLSARLRRWYWLLYLSEGSAFLLIGLSKLKNICRKYPESELLTSDGWEAARYLLHLSVKSSYTTVCCSWRSDAWCSDVHDIW